MEIKANLKFGRKIEKDEVKKEEEIIEDEVWGDRSPPIRKYDRITKRELHHLNSSSSYKEIQNNISYLEEFQKPYKIIDHEIKVLIDEIKHNLPQEFLETNNVYFDLSLILLI